MNTFNVVKLNRYEVILNIALTNNIGYKAARDIVESMNGETFSFPKQNGDTININNIYNKLMGENAVYHFYKSLKIATDSNIRNNRGELIYTTILSDKQIKFRNDIQLLTTINKSIFDGESTIFGKTMQKIKEKYTKYDTKSINRSLKTEKEFTAANYSTKINGNIIIFCYDRFEYEDFFNDTNKGHKRKRKNELIESINTKISKISGLQYLEEIEPNFKRELADKILDIFEVKEVIQDRILDLILDSSFSIKELKTIEDYIISIK